MSDYDQRAIEMHREWGGKVDYASKVTVEKPRRPLRRLHPRASPRLVSKSRATLRWPA